MHLNDLGTVKPKVVNGKTGEFCSERLAVLHASLPGSRIASIGIVNVFQQGAGDTIVFDETGFSGAGCLINGAKANFFDYAKETKLDLQLPLVADRSGEMINVSFQALDEATRSVKFYAPVLERVEYRQAAPIGDYRAAFEGRVKNLGISPAFSCNCILNYLYGHLEGKQNIPIGWTRDVRRDRLCPAEPDDGLPNHQRSLSCPRGGAAASRLHSALFCERMEDRAHEVHSLGLPLRPPAGAPLVESPGFAAFFHFLGAA